VRAERLMDSKNWTNEGAAAIVCNDRPKELA
jgi:hypothetical protein